MLNHALLVPKTRWAVWFGALTVLFLGLLIVFIVQLTKTEKTDFERIKAKVCQNESLNPEELARIIQLIAQSENVDLTDLNEIREYLCFGKKDYHFPDEKFLAKFLGTRDIHGVKEHIKKLTKKWQKKINAHNPDIGYNRKTGKLVLKNPSSGKTVETDLFLDSFIPK